MSYFERHIAPASAKPSSRAPFVGELDVPLELRLAEAGAIVCQPCQTSSSSFGSRLSAMIFVMSSRSRHSSLPGGQYFPLP